MPRRREKRTTPRVTTIVPVTCSITSHPNPALPSHREGSLYAPTDGHHISILTGVAWSRRNAMNLFGHYAAGLTIRKIGEKDRALLKSFFQQT